VMLLLVNVSLLASLNEPVAVRSLTVV
jgi:hypothetical protein